MRKSLMIISILVLFLNGCKTGVQISQKQLPNEIKTYLEEHFPEHEVIKVLTYQLETTVFYQVDLNYSVNIEFNGFTLEPIDIKGVSALPDSVIADEIREYISANYPSKIITGWKLDRPNQLIELENKVILEFNSQNDFIRFGD